MKATQEGNRPQTLRFDDQAADFDRRAGLPPEVCRAVAEAVESLAVHIPGLLLDLGAGTGEIGVQLAHGPRPYLGLDLSVPMLAAFRQKLAVAVPQVPGTSYEASRQVPGTGGTSSQQVPGTGGRSWLICADADSGLPVADHSAAVVFSSRAVHLLRLRHLVEEIERLRRPQGALLVLGGVHRPSDCVRRVLRRHMRRLMRQHGLTGRSGRTGRDTLRQGLTAKGWRHRGPQSIVSWTVQERPRDSLDAWSRKSGLAGWTLEAPLRRRLLEELRRCAEADYGHLDATFTTTETYQLESLSWPGTP